MALEVLQVDLRLIASSNRSLCCEFGGISLLKERAVVKCRWIAVSRLGDFRSSNVRVDRGWRILKCSNRQRKCSSILTGMIERVVLRGIRNGGKSEGNVCGYIKKNSPCMD